MENCCHLWAASLEPLAHRQNVASLMIIGPLLAEIATSKEQVAEFTLLSCYWHVL